MDRVLHPDTPKNLRSTTRHLCSDYSRSRREIAALHIDYAPHETEMRRFLAIRPIEIAASRAILLNSGRRKARFALGNSGFVKKSFTPGTCVALRRLFA
jgi:hypothetical protein